MAETVEEFDRTPCPCCGHLTDFSADILYHITRVIVWRDQSLKDPEAVAIYDAAIVELRAMAERERLSRGAPPPEPGNG